MRLVLFTASVFAVAAVTALVLTVAEKLPGVPLFTDLFKPTPPVVQTALSDEDKLAILATLSEHVAVTPENKKVAILNALAPKQHSETLTVDQKLEILNKLSPATTQ